ncbi:MAG: Hsp70 family protein [Verrucomicrobiota bacterium]|nr:Hsp70 family protein [Verrucomicrobiota bacterium]
MSKRKVVGIDLGTTFSAIAHIDEYGKPQIIPNAESERTTPSVILFEDSNVIVGSTAKALAVAEPEKIVEFVKREMGKPREEFNREVGAIKYSADELSAVILKKMKNDAEKYLAVTVTDAVITVPAYFNDAERNATMNAGKIAGLNVLQVINEPTAAALAYGINKLGKDQTVFVFDLGGGTFDVTIMKIDGEQIRMVATNGDHRLGGKDWDDKIINYVAEEFDKTHGENPLLDLQAYQDLQSRSIAAKIQLTNRSKTTVVHSHNGKSVKVDLSLDQFNQMCQDLVEKCHILCDIVLMEAKMTWKDIDTVLLVGGMTRCPMVRNMVRESSGKEPSEEVNPDEAVALGAAVQSMLCHIKESVDTGSNEVAPETIKHFTGSSGGLIQVTNITSHTLGIVLWNDVNHEEYVFPMIAKMTSVPCEIKNTFGTASANMKRVVVKVVEGESTVPEECTKLGNCEIELPEYLPKATPVEVTYRYNNNQILEVTVKAQDKIAHAEIHRSGGLNEKEVGKAREHLTLLNVA